MVFLAERKYTHKRRKGGGNEIQEKEKMIVKEKQKMLFEKEGGNTIRATECPYC